MKVSRYASSLFLIASCALLSYMDLDLLAKSLLAVGLGLAHFILKKPVYDDIWIKQRQRNYTISVPAALLAIAGFNIGLLVFTKVASYFIPRSAIWEHILQIGFWLPFINMISNSLSLSLRKR